MKVTIVSPSLDVSQNVSGISSVTSFIISRNQKHKYVLFEIGKKDGDQRGLKWVYQMLKIYIKWMRIVIFKEGDILHFNIALSKLSVIRDTPLVLFARLFHRQVILHIHGGELLMLGHYSKLIAIFLNVLLRNRCIKIVLSDLEREALQNKFSCNNVFVLPNCVDLNEARYVNKLDSSIDPIKLLFMSRFSVDKGLEFIYQALVRLKERGIKFKYIMAGKGPDEKLYLHRFGKLMGEDFDYRGVVSGSFKTELLKYCDVYLLPSLYEGLPMGLLESMSFGLVPIVTDVGSIRSVVADGESGIILTEPFSEKIAEAITRLSEDRKYLRELGRNAQSVILENHDPEKYISRLNEIYGFN